MKPRCGRVRRRLGGAPRRGSILLAVLVVVAVMALQASVVLTGTGQAAQREREQELLFIGEQYRRAIESYLTMAPGGVRQWPNRLEDLLEDQRFPVPVRHLRKLYRDPVNPEESWGLVQVGAGIQGVYSRSAQRPFKVSGFPDAQRHFNGATRYSDWIFKVEIRAPAGPTGGAAGAPPGRSPVTPPGSPQRR